MRRLLVVILAAGGCGNVGAGDPEPGPPDAAIAPDAMPDPGPQALFVGRPSPMTMVHRTEGMHYAPRLSSDGTRLYYAAAPGRGVGGAALFVSIRGADGGFGAGSPVTGDGWAAFDIPALGLSDDENEIFVQARMGGSYEIYTAKRGDRGVPFGKLEEVEVLSSASNECHPFLRGDELFFMSTRSGTEQLYVARRLSPGPGFAAPVALTIDGAPIVGNMPFLSSDGATLYFGRRPSPDTYVIASATRTAPGATRFGPARELSALSVPARYTSGPFVDEARGEIVFESNRAWTPLPPDTIGLWRARLCKGAACEEPAIECAAGLRSDDQRHCYTAFDSAAGWDAARKACVDKGGHLATLNSAAEHALVARLIPAAAPGGYQRGFVGGTDAGHDCTLASCPRPFTWEGNEPFLYAAVSQRAVWFTDTQPDNGGTSGTVEDCLELVSAGIGSPLLVNDVPCAGTRAYVCERESP